MRMPYIAVLLLLLGTPREALGQRRAPPEPNRGPGQSMAITVDVKIGSRRYHASGKGACRHAPDASIRGVPASLWMVEFAGEGAGLKELRLTLWRPKDDGPDQLTLNLETSSGAHRIATGESGGDVGEGTVTILPSGPGGRLEINGKEARGKAVQAAIDCPAFAEVTAEGG